MKNYITLFSFVLLAAISASAQKISIKVSESNERIGSGKNNSLVVMIYDNTTDEVEKAWRSLMKDYKGKVSSSNDGIFADNAVIKEINDNNTIDVYARTEKVKDAETKLIVAFDLGGSFLNSSDHKDKFKEARRIVYDFAVKATKDAIAGQRKSEEKKLRGLEDEQRDLEKQNKKLNGNIEDYKAKIEDYKKRIKEAEDELSKNKTDQEKKKGEIETQKKTVDAVAAKEKAVE